MKRDTGSEGDLDRLSRVAASLGPALTAAGENELLQSIVSTAALVFEAPACSIAALDETCGELVFTVSSRGSEDKILGTRLPAGRGIAGWAATSGQAIAVDEVARDPRFARDVAEAVGYVPNSILAMPIEGQSEVLGVIEVLDRRDGAHDMELVGAFAQQAALAMENSRFLSDLSSVLIAGAQESAKGAALARALEEVAQELPRGQAELAELASVFAELGEHGPQERAAATRLVTHFLTYVRARTDAS